MSDEQQQEEGQQQQQLLQSQQTKGTRSFRGVYKCGKRFKAQLQCGGVQFYLGTFDTEEDAAKAYDKKCREEKGMRGLTNFDDTGHARTPGGSIGASDDTPVASGERTADTASSSSSSSSNVVATTVTVASSSSSSKNTKRVAVEIGSGVVGAGSTAPTATGTAGTGGFANSSSSSCGGRPSTNCTGHVDKSVVVTPLDPHGNVNVHVATEANGLQVLNDD